MADQKKPRATWKKVLLGIVGVFILLLVIANLGGKDSQKQDSSATASTPASSPVEDMPKISAVELSKAYGANEVSADQSYKGKKIEITGTVESISKDALDNIYVILKGKDEFSEVQVYVSDANKAAQLKKNQVLTVDGECDGMILNSPIIRSGVIKE